MLGHRRHHAEFIVRDGALSKTSGVHPRRSVLLLRNHLFFARRRCSKTSSGDDRAMADLQPSARTSHCAASKTAIGIRLNRRRLLRPRHHARTASSVDLVLASSAGAHIVLSSSVHTCRMASTSSVKDLTWASGSMAVVHRVRALHGVLSRVDDRKRSFTGRLEQLRGLGDEGCPSVATMRDGEAAPTGSAAPARSTSATARWCAPWPHCSARRTALRRARVGVRVAPGSGAAQPVPLPDARRGERGRAHDRP